MYSNFTGRLVREPELSNAMVGGVSTPVCHLVIADNSNNRTQNGVRSNSDTLFVRVSAWRNQALNCAQNLHTGALVSVNGKVTRVQGYLRNDGTPAAAMDVRADSIEFLLRPNDNGQTAQAPATPAPAQTAAPAPAPAAAPAQAPVQTAAPAPNGGYIDIDPDLPF